MAQILLRVDETEFKQIEEKSSEFGLSKAAFIRQILRESFRKSTQKEQLPESNLKYNRALVQVMAEALGRTTKEYNQERTEKLTQTLLKIYDQKVQ
jgi:hypothetical protein